MEDLISQDITTHITALQEVKKWLSASSYTPDFTAIVRRHQLDTMAVAVDFLLDNLSKAKTEWLLKK